MHGPPLWDGEGSPRIARTAALLCAYTPDRVLGWDGAPMEPLAPVYRPGDPCIRQDGTKDRCDA
jgi:hypothetical protein